MDRLHSRLLVAVVCLALVSSLGAAAGPAKAAPPGTTLVKSARVLIVNGGRAELCVDDTDRVGAALMIAEEYRNRRGDTVTMGRFTGQRETIGAQPSNANVVSVAPASWRQPSSYRGGRSNFVFTAIGQGTATVTFTDGRGIAAPAAIPVVVKDCHYEISITGTWHIAAGFQPTVVQTLTAVRLDYDQATGEHTSSPSAMNQATAPNSGGCTITYGVPRSIVRIKMTEDPKRKGQLQVSISYFPITNVIPLVCHIPYGVYAGSGQGKVRSLNLPLTLVGNTATATVRGHVLDADGEWPGTTRITIKKVPN